MEAFTFRLLSNDSRSGVHDWSTAWRLENERTGALPCPTRHLGTHQKGTWPTTPTYLPRCRCL